jgi:threonine dehydrogenase-like Zn-dependent dehydrogenase
MLGGYPGGQAEYARVPFADTNHVKVPAGLSDEKVVFLSDIFPTGYMAAEMCNIQEGDTVAVWGCGPVGLFAMRSAWLMGAGRVIGVDCVDYRLEFARRWAGVETLDFEEVDVVAMMRKGVLIAQGTPTELQERIGASSIEEAFIHYGGDEHED